MIACRSVMGLARFRRSGAASPHQRIRQRPSAPARRLDARFRGLVQCRKLCRSTAMADAVRDIFTEPEDVDPDTLANLGPLRRLAGVWEGAQGPGRQPQGRRAGAQEFIERIEMQPIDPQANGPQLFYGLRYHIHIVKPDEAITFHDQVGYWLWEPATGPDPADPGHPARPGRPGQGPRQPRTPSSFKVYRAARRDRLRHLLDHLPRVRLPHRVLRHRGHLPRGRHLELFRGHGADGARARRNPSTTKTATP